MSWMHLGMLPKIMHIFCWLCPVFGISRVAPPRFLATSPTRTVLIRKPGPGRAPRKVMHLRLSEINHQWRGGGPAFEGHGAVGHGSSRPIHNIFHCNPCEIVTRRLPLGPGIICIRYSARASRNDPPTSYAKHAQSRCSIAAAPVPALHPSVRQYCRRRDNPHSDETDQPGLPFHGRSSPPCSHLPKVHTCLQQL